MGKFSYITRKKRYTPTEAFLIAHIIRNRIDMRLWNNDTIEVDHEENAISFIKNKYGEKVLSIFNHIEIISIECITKELEKLTED